MFHFENLTNNKTLDIEILPSNFSNFGEYLSYSIVTSVGSFLGVTGSFISI